MGHLPKDNVSHVPTENINNYLVMCNYAKSISLVTSVDLVVVRHWDSQCETAHFLTHVRHWDSRCETIHFLTPVGQWDTMLSNEELVRRYY